MGDIFKSIILLFEKYGTNGLNIATLGLLCFVSWKLCTNHLKHMQDAIEETTKLLKTVYKKVKSNSEDISYLKGLLEAKKK